MSENPKKSNWFKQDLLDVSSEVEKWPAWMKAARASNPRKLELSAYAMQKKKKKAAAMADAK